MFNRGMAMHEDETTRDYLLAINQELASLDKDIQVLLHRRLRLVDTRELLLAERKAKDAGQPERRRQKSGATPKGYPAIS